MENSMNKPSAKMLVAKFDGAYCIKICGRANFTSSLDLKKLANELVGRNEKVLLDLSECEHMDSTFLGGLAGMGLQLCDPARRPSAEPVELFNPKPRVIELLENVGVSHLFKITTDAVPLNGEFKPVAPNGNNAGPAEMARSCLEAHRTLMAINPDNVPKFKDVAEFLAEDLKKLEGKS
jgi:anti-anti-sigma regulatory factor